MNSRLRLGIRGKTTATLGGLIFLLLFATSFASYWQSRNITKQQIMKLEQSKLALLKHEIETGLSAHRNNLLSLHDIPTVSATVRALANNQGVDPESGEPLQTLREHTTFVFQAFLANHPEYFQIRFIDAAGNELVRVERTPGGQATATADSELQNKSGWPYVSQTLKLQPGGIYYSDVNLNREHGEIQVPYVPVLRMASPVHDANKQPAGLIVINLSTEKLFSDVDSEDNGVQRNIANEKGYFIKHADQSKAFGFDLGHDDRLQNSEPELFEISKSSDEFARWHDLDDELDGFHKIRFSAQDRSRYWLLVMHIPKHIVFADISAALDRMLMLSLLIGALSLLFIIWYVSRKILTPVVNLASAARQLQRGDLNVRVDAKSVRDEFRTLYKATNAFAESQQLATDRLKTEIREESDRLYAVINNAVDGIITINESGLIAGFNHAAEKIFGYRLDEVFAENVNILMPEPYHSEHDGYLEHYKRTGEKKIIGSGRELTARKKDGSSFPIELAISEVLINNVRHFVGIVRDITERKAYEQQIIDEKIQLAAVIDNAVDGIVTIGEQGEIKTFNPAAGRIFGYADSETIGQNVKMLMPEPYHSEHDSYLKRYQETGEKKVIGKGRTVTGRRKDGSSFPMSLAVSEMVIGQERQFLGLIRDITVEKKNHEYLHLQATALQAAANGIIITDPDGTIIWANKAAERITGYSTNELLGNNPSILKSGEHDESFYKRLWDTIKQGEVWHGELINRRKDGSTYPEEETITPVLDSRGKISQFIAIKQDISERKRVEQMQKEFVSTVSHELRTPLTSIRGSLGLILGGVTGELPEKAQSLLTIANNNSERLIHLINDILDIEKISAGKMQFEFKITDLVPVIRQAIESNRGYAEQLNVRFELVAAPENGVLVRIDEKRIAQVMSNLLSNAAKYSPASESVDISIETAEKNVRVSVHDHGKGIPEEFKSRIFSKFAQADSSDTRQKGGTGLGLSITKAIVEQHGGSIGFDSDEGMGTTFYVDLPIWQEQRMEDGAAQNEETDKPLLLIVEDDPDVSNLLGMMLEKHGYQYHKAFSYQQATELLRTHTYAAVTLDLIIPGGSGARVLHDIRSSEDTRDLPVVVISANVQEGALMCNGNTSSVLDWLEKPIDEPLLVDSIQRALKGKSDHDCSILHVEDDLDIAMIVKSILRNEKCAITHVTTLDEAKKVLNEKSFELLLLDIGLPDGSGLDLLPIAEGKSPALPVIIFSAHDIDAGTTGRVSASLLKSRTDNDQLIRQIQLAMSRKENSD